MAANGYIVANEVRPRWNRIEDGEEVMDDYLSAIDDVAKESYVDKERLGCVSKLWWLFSLYLAGIHNTVQNFHCT
jgi:hypothetical protein